jgi:hypothetical protein
MKNGTKFEELTAEILVHLRRDKSFETVEHNVFLDGKDGPRQIDVFLKGKVGPFDVTTIVECKDYAKNINVTAIDALHSKMQDVNAQKAVLVARKGFSRTAIKKAKRLGISLCTAHSAKSEKWKFQLEVPLIIKELSCELSQPSFMFRAIPNQKGVRLDEFCGVPLPKILGEYWNNNQIKCQDGTNEHIFRPQLPEPHYVYVPDGRKLEIFDFHIKMFMKQAYYFGYFNDLESSKYIEFIEEKERHVIFDPKDLSDYRTKMVNYGKYEDIPKISGGLHIELKLLHNPKATVKMAEQRR